MQKTHSRIVSVLFVLKAAPNTEMSLIRLLERLQSCHVNNRRNKKASTQITHSSVVSMVLVAKAGPSADMLLIRLLERLQSCHVNNRRNKN